MRQRRLLGPWLLLMALDMCLGGCANRGLRFDELPDAPVAFFYRNREEAGRRAEALERASEVSLGPQTRGTQLYLNDASEFLGLGLKGQNRIRAMLGRVALLDPKTREPRVLDAMIRGSRPLVWSSDHRRLLFTSIRRGGRAQLFEYDAESGDVRQLTHGVFDHPLGSYGPLGRLALCRIERRGKSLDSRIFVTRPGGGGARPVTAGPGDCGPAWSPDGEWILYDTRGPRGQRLIARVRPEGSGPGVIIARGRNPSFSRDGSWVVYSAKTRKGWRIRRMRPDGSGKLPVGEGITEEHDPVFSPDGRYVLFVAEENFRERLVVRTLDGRAERILFHDGGASFPTW